MITFTKIYYPKIRSQTKNKKRDVIKPMRLWHRSVSKKRIRFSVDRRERTLKP